MSTWTDGTISKWIDGGYGADTRAAIADIERFSKSAYMNDDATKQLTGPKSRRGQADNKTKPTAPKAPTPGGSGSTPTENYKFKVRDNKRGGKRGHCHGCFKRGHACFKPRFVDNADYPVEEVVHSRL